jgi:hypothetical protein
MTKITPPESQSQIYYRHIIYKHYIWNCLMWFSDILIDIRPSFEVVKEGRILKKIKQL